MSARAEESVPANIDYRSPVARARGLGSAKSGSGHFWWQRVTAVLLVLLVAWLLGTLLSLVGADLVTVRAALARPFNAIAMSLLVITLYWHAKLGLQVVVEDYVHSRGVEIALQLLVTFTCTIAALASLYAIGRIAFLA